MSQKEIQVGIELRGWIKGDDESEYLFHFERVWHHQRPKQDFAELLRFLSDDEHPDAEKIVLVTDDLNPHSPACLYERFEPAEARRLAQRFE